MANNNFDWRNPDFSVQLLKGTDYTPQEQAAVYASKAPKRSKTLRKKPRNNYQTYQWGKDMTFEEKARMLAHDGVLGNHVRNSSFIDDFDRYQAPEEQVMEYLRNAPANIQRYYGVYDDLHKAGQDEFTPVYDYAPAKLPADMVNPQRKSDTSAKRLNYDGMSFKQAFAAAHKAGLNTFNWRGKDYTTQLASTSSSSRNGKTGRRSSTSVPQPTIEPEPMDRVDGFAVEDLRTPESVMRDVVLPSAKRINPFVTAGGAALDLQTPIMRGAVQVPQYGWGGWLPLICP